MKLAITLGILWGLFLRIDIQPVFARFLQLDPIPLTLAVLLLTANVLTGGVRWSVVLRALSASVPPLRAVTLCVIGNFFNSCLPGGIGGDAYRIWSVRRDVASLSLAVNSVLLERSCVLLCLFVGVVAEYPLLVRIVGQGPFVQVLLLLGLAGIAAIGCILLLDRAPAGWRRWRPIRALAALARDARHLLLRPTSALPSIALSFSGIALYSLAIYFLARSLGIAVTAGDCLVLVPLTMLVTVLPITLGGWGLREGATVFVFGAVGVAPGAALAWSITTGVVGIAVSLVGGLLWLLPTNRERATESLRSIP